MRHDCFLELHRGGDEKKLLQRAHRLQSSGTYDARAETRWNRSRDEKRLLEHLCLGPRMQNAMNAVNALAVRVLSQK